MPISSKLFRIQTYPTNFPIETSPFYAQGTTVELRTKVRVLGQSEYGNYQKLEVIHDYGKRFNGIGYSDTNGRIEDLVMIANEKSFPAFVDEPREWLIGAYSSKKIFNGAFQRLSQTIRVQGETTLDAQPVKVKLGELKAYLEGNSGEGPAIRGGWFNGLTLANVRVAYLGGDDVTDSDEWDRYENNGEISALRLDVPNEDLDEQPYSILITKDASLISYTHFNERDFLEICTTIFEVVKNYLED